MIYRHATLSKRNRSQMSLLTPVGGKYCVVFNNLTHFTLAFADRAEAERVSVTEGFQSGTGFS